jgi:dihydrofolate reductase
MTMKLTASMMLTVDGVYQGPGGPDEDRRGGFDRGGWTASHADEEGWTFLTSYFERADAFLLGRRTWEIWEPYWPLHDSGDPVSHGINVLPKYVPSTTLTDPTWQNTHVISGDVEAAVRELRRSPGASCRSMAAAPCSGGCSSATSSMSSTCASTPSWWATGCGCSRSTARRTI